MLMDDDKLIEDLRFGVLGSSTRAIARIQSLRDEVERWHHSYKVAFGQAMSNGQALSDARHEVEAAKAAGYRAGLEAAAEVADNIANVVDGGKNVGAQAGSMLSAHHIRALADLPAVPGQGDTPDRGI